MDNIKLHIKRVDSLDIGPLREMSFAFAQEEGNAYPTMDAEEIDKQMLYILANKDNATLIYLIAYAGKKPVGFGLFYIGQHEWSRPARVLVGQELYVVPDKRGGQIAPRIVRRAFELGVQLGVEGIEALGSYNGTDKHWKKLGLEPHLTYLHMPKDKFEQIMEKITKEGSHPHV